MNFIKKTILALAAVFSAQTMSAQPYMSERLSMEGVDIISSEYYLKVNAYDAGEPGYYAFKYDDQYQGQYTTPLKTGYVCGGSTYHDGKIYACEYNDGAHLDKQKPHWVIYNAKTFEKLYDREMEDNYALTTLSLAYDPTENVIYAIGRTYMETYLLKIDPATGDATRITGADGNPNVFRNDVKYEAIGCDKAGKLFIVYMQTVAEGDESLDTWHLVKVRKTDAKFSEVGTGINVENGVNSDYYQNDVRKQCLFTNARTGKMYWFFPANSSNACIAELNTKTANATIKAYMAQPVVSTGAFFVEPALKAPSIATEFKYMENAVGALAGKLQFKLPAEAYDGTALTGNLTITVKEGKKVLVNAKAEAGSVFTSGELNFTNSNHTVSITISNEAGEGPTINRTFFVGYDTPSACTDITLTSEGLKTTLSWTAPTKGTNGSPIDTEKLRYKVTRYGARSLDEPSEVVVAEDLKECKFEEEHPADMTRYVYLVQPYVGEIKGVAAYSNNLIVGTPLDLPYGGPFQSPFDFMNYYTIIDDNQDNKTWKYAGGEVYYEYSTDNDADDWIISPPINFKKGGKYCLMFNAASVLPDYPEALEVTFGSDRTIPTQMQRQLWFDDALLEAQQGELPTYTVDFTVPEDGVYYYGFHCYSPAYSGSLRLANIFVYDKDVTAVSSASMDSAKKTIDFTTNIAGQRTSGMQKGINIIKMNDGSVKKVIVK